MSEPPIDSNVLAEHARESLIQDHCGTSRYLYTANFSDLELLRSTIEELITREETGDINQVATVADSLPHEHRGEFWADNHPYGWEDIIAPQFRGAFFMALMSAVEAHLGRIAQDAAVICRAPIDADELRGGVYQRTRRFLERFCAIAAPDEASWQRIGSYYAVRNALVHAGGFIRDGATKRQIEALARQVPGLELWSNLIEVRREFCEAALTDCRAFLDALFAELHAACDRATRARTKAALPFVKRDRVGYPEPPPTHHCLPRRRNNGPGSFADLFACERRRVGRRLSRGAVVSHAAWPTS